MSLPPMPSQKLTTHKIPLTSPAAPPPAPFLSSAILHRDGNIVYVSGALGIKAGKMATGGIERRFEQAISNASALLGEAKASLTDGKSSFPTRRSLQADPCDVWVIIVVTVTIYLANISRDIAAINKAFQQAFQGGVAPTLTIVETSALPFDTDVEVTWYVHMGPQSETIYFSRSDLHIRLGKSTAVLNQKQKRLEVSVSPHQRSNATISR